MLPTTLRNALLSIAVFLPAHVLADDDDIVTFQFSACVSTCLGTTGYSMDGEDNQKEMCKASRDGLLEVITTCLVSNCLEELIAVDANLLQPMQTGCKELEKPVSDDEIEDAASAAANIQATLAASTSTSTTSSSSEPTEITPTAPSFEPLGVETETSTIPDLFTIPMPTETPTILEPAAEVTTLSPAPTTVTEPTVFQPEPEVPAETQTTTPDLNIPSETRPPPETVTSAEPSSSSAAAAIVPVAQITDISPAQPAPEATTAVAEPPSSPTPSLSPASVSTSTQGEGHANQIQPETTPGTTQETTVLKPTSTDNANTQQPQETTAPEQGHANKPIAYTTTSAVASKTQGSEPKATHTAGISNSSSQHSDDDDEEEYTSSSETSTPTPEISGELVLATGTPTASSSPTGFATSVTAVTATPSASGTQTASSDDVDGGLGGGSPFSVVMASAATTPRNAPCLWAPLLAMMGMFVSLIL